MPLRFAVRLCGLFSQYPLSTSSGQTVDLEQVQSSISDVQSDSQSQSVSGDSMSDGGPSLSNTDITSISSVNSSTVNLDVEVQAFVFLLVKASRFQLAQIEVAKIKALDFFKGLINTYSELRSLWRYWFWVSIYSHCDFVRVSKSI